jgi:hypothetical protein
MTQSQREAIFDFLLIAMYADGNIALSENSRLYELISGLGWESYQDARAYSDRAISRVRGAVESEEGLDPFLAAISARLADDDVKKMALILFARLMEVDETIAASEYEVYSRAKALFGL